MADILNVLYIPPRGSKRAALIYRPFSAMPPERGAAWSAWCERMGIDPNEVPLSASIVCDDKACTVTYPVVVDWCEDECISENKVIQLEAPALPFPGSPF
jgi:hypothetical protein